MTAPGGLRRDVGRLGLLFLSLGAVIGSGWLFAPMTAASAAGPAAILSWVLAGGVVALLALQLAELGAAYPVAGGVVRCTALAFGPVVGFVTGWVAWLAITAGVALICTVCVVYLNSVVDGLATLAGPTPVLTGWGVVAAVLLIVVFTALNALGIKVLSRTNTAIMWVKLAVPVLVVIALLLASFHLSNFTAGGGFAPHGLQGIVQALPLGVVFSLLGFEQAVHLGGEAKDPARAIPRAVIGALCAATALYVLLQGAFIVAVNPDTIAGGWAAAGSGDNATFGTLASALGLGVIVVVVTANAILSPAGAGLVLSASAPRLLYALGREATLPAAVNRVNSRGAPIVGIACSAVASILLLTPFPTVQQLVQFLTAGATLVLGFVPLSLAVLRRTDPDRPRPYRMPAVAALVPVAFVCTTLVFHWAGWNAGSRVIIAALVGVLLLTVARHVPLGGRQPLGPAALRASAWLWPYLAGLAVLGYLGPFGGGRDVIPFGWDTLLVAAFSLLIYRIALRASAATSSAASAPVL